MEMRCIQGPSTDRWDTTQVGSMKRSTASDFRRLTNVEVAPHFKL